MIASPAAHDAFSVAVVKASRATRARVLRMTTPHGAFLTPVFMPVGTYAAVSALTPEDLRRAGAQVILGGNTYHMICAPGLPVIQAAGGMHRFMAWNGPMLTDSGGFQIFSLSRRSEHARIDDDGATFVNPASGQKHRMTPTSAIEAQRIIGADMIMAFDQCTPDQADRAAVREAMARTHRWLDLCCAYHREHPRSTHGAAQALFGIVQGGSYVDLRRESAEVVASKDVAGVALGGESIGFNMRVTAEILDDLEPRLPADKPRYTMGVGLVPQDLLDVVRAGVDMFDCVSPTRMARHGHVYVGKIVRDGAWLRWESPEKTSRINLQNKRFELDEGPIQDGCRCATCAAYSRSYLRYLLKARSIIYHCLASAHNVHVMGEVCAAMRALILDE